MRCQVNSDLNGNPFQGLLCVAFSEGNPHSLLLGGFLGLVQLPQGPAGWLSLFLPVGNPTPHLGFCSQVPNSSEQVKAIHN